MAELNDAKDEPGPLPEIPGPGKTSVGPSAGNKQKIPAKLVAAGCIGLALMCCLCSGLGLFLEAAEKRQKCGPPAIARVFAEKCRESARTYDAELVKATGSGDKRLLTILRDSYIDAAGQIEGAAASLTDANLVDAMAEHQRRLSMRVTEQLGTFQGTLTDPKDRAHIQRFIDQEAPVDRAALARLVDDKRRELEQKYEQERRSRRAPLPKTTGLFEPDRSSTGGGSTGTPSGATTAGYFAITVNSTRLVDSAGSGPLSMQAGPGNKYLVINATVQNTDNEARMFLAGSLLVGRAEYDAHEPVMADGYLSAFENLNPQTTWTGNIAWKVPASLTGPVDWQPGRSGARIRVRD